MAGTALTGPGVLDITLKLGSEAKTTTAQYKAVAMDPTSTTGDFTANFPVTTAALNAPVGIIQNYITANASSAQVRVLGISKAYCYDSIVAGAPVAMALKTAGGAYTGYIVAAAPSGAWTGTGTVTRALGWALSGSTGATCTGSAISVLLNPHTIIKA